ncbi:MAG: malonyl-ACP O-methyltransferase BioC [Gammaproteobacteria bacterium]
MPEQGPTLDLTEVRRAFDRAAESYDKYAVLQREVGDRALSQFGFMQIEPRIVLDLGAGTGHCARQLEKRFRRARVVLLDIAPNMLKTARARHRTWRTRAHYVCNDLRTLSLKSSSVDIIFSNLVLQWCGDLLAAFKECRRVLCPGGLFLFSSLGPDTLQELRLAWSTVDGRSHVNTFRDMHEVGDALIASGFSSPVLDRECLTMTYRDVLGLMSDLKGIGAHNSLEGRSRGLTGKATFAAMRAAYECRRVNGVLPASFEVVYGHAWAPTSTTRPQDGSTVATFPFKNLGRRLR